MAKILTLDDDPFSQKLIRLTLETGGHEVHCLNDPKELLPFTKKQALDLIVLDILMPRTTGWDLLSKIREYPKTRHIPVLMLSSLSDAPHKVRGLQAGANEYLTKPFDPEELLIRVNMLLRQRLPQDAVLSGKLSGIPIPNLLEYFSLQPQNGLLEIHSGGEIGEIVLNQKTISHASIGPLKGKEAVETICEFTEGTFHFNPDKDKKLPPSSDVLEINRVLIDIAWMEDLLDMKTKFLPEPDTPLKVNAKPLRLEKKLAFLPADKLRSHIHRMAGPTLAKLQSTRFCSPIRLKLALAIMAEQKVLFT